MVIDHHEGGHSGGSDGRTDDAPDRISMIFPSKLQLFFFKIHQHQECQKHGSNVSNHHSSLVKCDSGPPVLGDSDHPVPSPQLLGGGQQTPTTAHVTKGSLARPGVKLSAKYLLPTTNNLTRDNYLAKILAKVCGDFCGNINFYSVELQF